MGYPPKFPDLNPPKFPDPTAAGCFLAVVALGSVGSLCREATTNRAHEATFLVWLKVSAEACRAITQSPPWFLISGLVAGPSVLLTWYWRDEKRRDDHLLARQSGAAARYTAVAQLLRSRELMARINGVHALWDLAQESPDHRKTVARTLAAFIGTKADIDHEAVRAGKEVFEPPKADAQDAMQILCDRQWAEESWLVAGKRITAELRWRDFQSFELERANLDSLNLSYSWFTHANLWRASLRAATLTHCAMNDCNLVGADLERADLKGASLRGANLTLAHGGEKLTQERAHVEAHGARVLRLGCRRGQPDLADWSPVGVAGF